MLGKELAGYPLGGAPKVPLTSPFELSPSFLLPHQSRASVVLGKLPQDEPPRGPLKTLPWSGPRNCSLCITWVFSLQLYRKSCEDSVCNIHTHTTHMQPPHMHMCIYIYVHACIYTGIHMCVRTFFVHSHAHTYTQGGAKVGLQLFLWKIIQ